MCEQVPDGAGGHRLEQVTPPLSAPIPALPYSQFLTLIRQLWSAASLEARLGTHAFRIGGTTAMVRGGADRERARKQGRWQDPNTMEKHYAHDAPEGAVALAAAALQGGA